MQTDCLLWVTSSTRGSSYCGLWQAAKCQNKIYQLCSRDGASCLNVCIGILYAYVGAKLTIQLRIVKFAVSVETWKCVKVVRILIQCSRLYYMISVGRLHGYSCSMVSRPLLSAAGSTEMLRETVFCYHTSSLLIPRHIKGVISSVNHVVLTYLCVRRNESRHADKLTSDCFSCWAVSVLYPVELGLYFKSIDNVLNGFLKSTVY